MTEASQQTLKIFPAQGAVNELFNEFADFLYNRNSEQITIVKDFVKKLDNICGNEGPMGRLTKRISDDDLNFGDRNSNMYGLKKAAIDEMKQYIKQFSQH